MTKSCGVYAIKNVRTGKVYVGSAVWIESRWSYHKAALNGGYHHSQKLQRSWRKHGHAVFSFRIIELCSKRSLRTREQYHIDRLHSWAAGYNVNPRAENMTGWHHSTSAKAKMSVVAKAVARRLGESAKRSARAKAQHAAGKLGWSTMSEASREKVRRAGARAFKKHGAKGRAAAFKLMTPAEMSRRSYCRQIFKEA